MILRLDYTSTPVGQIGKALALAAERARENHAHRSVTINNVIIPLGSIKLLGSIDGVLDLLARVHPGRIFVTYPSSTKTLEAATALRLSVLSKTEAVSSEIVRLGFDHEDLGAMLSVLRENFMPGVKTEVFLLDRELSRDQLSLLMGLADVLIFDSGELEKTSGLVGHIVSHAALHRSELVDLQWIGLGVWREQVRQAFSKVSCLSALEHLSQIEISVNSDVPNGFSSCALLMGGWLINRLGRTLQSYGKPGFSCFAADRRQILLSISPVSGGPLGLGTIRFAFGVARPALELKIEDLPDTAKRGSAISQLTHYYEIGESLQNYRDSLLTAIELDELHKGF